VRVTFRNHDRGGLRCEALRDIATDIDITLVVSGECMSPWLRNGQRIRVRPCRWYWPGDILALRDPEGRWISHRVIGYRPRGVRLQYMTQADVATTPDRPVNRDRVLGRVVGGDCSPEACRPPLAHRLHALWRFVQLSLDALARRFGAGP